MNRAIAVLLAAVVLVAEAPGKLVPKNFSDNPPIQKLTRAYTRENWNVNGFGQCQGIACKPILRKSTQQTVFYLWAISDPACACVAYGVESEENGEREIVVSGQYGDWGTGPGGLKSPNGLAIDTVCYNELPDDFYFYIAECGNCRITRCKFTWSTHYLQYYDTLDLNLICPIDVACIAEPDGHTSLLAILDAGASQIMVLRVNEDLTYQTLATFGTQGPGEGQFSFPRGISICPKGQDEYYIYVTDPGNFRVISLVMKNEGGGWEIHWSNAYNDYFWSAGFTGITTDGIGYVYVTARHADAIYAFTQNLEQLSYVQDNGMFSGPRDVASIGDELALTENWTDTSRGKRGRYPYFLTADLGWI